MDWAETALRDAEERYRTLVESSIQGISIVSQDGRRLFTNQALLNILGYDCFDTYIRHDPLDNVAPHERDRIRGYREAQLRGECAPTHYEYQGLRTDGTPLWLERLVMAITWDGQPALFSTLLDITEHKQAESERQRLEAQLRQAQKMEAIGSLAGGIAHDFNNILAIIMSCTTLATYEVGQGGAAWAHLQDVFSACERAKHLVQQILTFSRQTDQRRTPAQVAPLVEAALTLLRATLPTTIDIRQSS